MGWTRVGVAVVLGVSALVAVAGPEQQLAQAAPPGVVDGPDFDNDGFVDLVVGMPHVPTGGSVQLAGALAVVYGDNQYSGPEDGTPAFDHDPFEGRKQVITLNSLGLEPDEFDALGYNFVWGDFNADGIDDLAAGVPLKDVEVAAGVVLRDAGQVLVISGQQGGGLVTGASGELQVLDFGDVTNGSPQTGDWFGDSLVVGDFNGDGRDDLAVGTPYREGRAVEFVEREDQGRVDIFTGSGNGLRHLQSVTPDDEGVVLGVNARFFGTSLGAGDVNGDGADELVVASLASGTNNGRVSVVYSSNSEQGLDTGATPPDARFQPLAVGANVPSQRGDGLGEAVDVGDFNGDGFGDVVAGAPKLDVLDGSGILRVDAGGVVVVSGSAGGIAPNATATRPGFTVLTQETPDVPDGSERSDEFGSDVAVGYFDFDDFADLALSAPGESIGSIETAGAVVAIFGALNVGLSATTRPIQAWHQNSPNIAGAAEAGDRLGETLAIADYDSDGTHDLAMGAPLEDIGASFFDAGSVNVIFGGTPGLSDRGNQQLFVSGDRLDDNSGFVDVFGFVGVNQRFGAGLDGEGLEDDWARIRRGPSTAPREPRAFIGDGTVTLIWQPPVDTGGSLLDYVIDGPGFNAGQFNSNLSTSSVVLANLPNDQEATHTIRGSFGGPGVEISATPRGALRAINPTRFAETRNGPDFTTFDGQSQGQGRVSAGSELRFDATRGPVDADASAVMLNVVAVGPAAAGFLVAYPCEGEPPLAASVNYQAGDVLPNVVFSRTSADGDVCIFSSADTDVVVDVTGYVPADGTTVSMRPARYLETRPGEQTFDGVSETGVRVGAGQEVRVQIADRGVIPGGVRTALLNLAVIDAAAPGFAMAYPCTDRPDTANVNYGAGGVTSNAVTAQLTFDGDVCIFTSAEADIVVDAYGYIEGAFSPRALQPSRLVDTRTDGSADTVDGQFEATGRIGAGQVESFTIAGRGGVDFVGTDAALLNVVAVGPLGPGYLTVFPCDEDPPIAANVNYARGDVAGNSVLAKMAANGTICVFSLAETDVVIDANGVIDGDPRVRD